MNTPWTPEEDAIVREKFRTGKNITRDVMPFLPNRTYNAIRARSIKYLGVQMKKPFSYNRQVFAIPSEKNCSIAGFLAADGHVAENGRMTINLASKDREHLQMIVDFLEYTGHIYDYQRAYTVTPKKHKNTKSYSGILRISTLQIQCPDVCKDLLNNWNITTRKTRTLCPPPLTEPRLVMAFLSGFIDGDGWIVIEKEDEHGIYLCSLGVMGTKQMMSWVKDVLDVYIPSASTATLQPTESEDIYEYKITGAKLYWLFKMFLSLDIPRLDRKWDKAR